MTVAHSTSASVHEQLADVIYLQTWRERASWEAAARHLNAHGFAAAVPAELMRPLLRLGVAVWPAERRVV